MSAVECFWLEGTDAVKVFLRRYDNRPDDVREPCSASGYGCHNASVFLETRAAIWGEACEDNPRRRYLDAQEHPRTAPEWPTVCACGYVFTDAEVWQVNQSPLYRRAGVSAFYTLDEAPAGAMWDAWWMWEDHRGPDGISLTVKLPGGYDWPVDGPSYSGGKMQNARGWSRTGAIPRVTANPSILIPGLAGQPDRYHGWLRDGVLVPC